MTTYNIYSYEVKAGADLCGAKANEDTTWPRWFRLGEAGVIFD